MNNFGEKIKRQIKNKISSSCGGFSILEMLLAVVILLLATQLVTGAMDLAAKRYIESTNRSKAQMIMSTLSDFVRSTLTTASDIVLEDEMSFIDGSGLVGGRCVLQGDGTSICLKNLKTGDSYYPIVGSEDGGPFDYANNLRVSYKTSPSREDEKIIFNYEITVEDKNGKQLASGKYAVTVKAGDNNQ
ncbi:hypothetical protein [Butyrivibrio sp. JL13D10]|uniref:hypothetical protein n=1 Tax=Butyrivibrio sp. JL13D10 TaxID=3236815 RepID=UPI0038B542D1